MASRRLQYEVRKFQREDKVALGFDMAPKENTLFEWEGRLRGPPNSPYENGEFRFEIKISTEYPHKPPKLHFLTPILHPNINKKGCVCVDILQDAWSPALTLTKVMISVRSLLNAPNENDPYNVEMAELFRSDISRYEKKVRSHVEQFAKVSPFSVLNG